MGRNLIGGKNYKKTKHCSEKPAYQVKEDDQLWGRIYRILGGKNTLVYCNDNEIRLCHIRGSIRKDNWISVGDIVLISIRDLNNLNDLNNLKDKDKYEKGDIIYKYDRDYHSKLRKEPTINPKLFLNLETATDDALKLIKQNKVLANGNNDEGFDFGEEDGSGSDNDSGSNSGSDVDINAI
jgi:translation initiation factor 1A